MAKRSSYRRVETKCRKVKTNCQICKRDIKRSGCSEDNYCDDCEDIVRGEIQLHDSGKNDFDVRKIDFLSGLARDRKNRFLFVGEGNFSFTVAFNAYRQSLLSMRCSLISFGDYPLSWILFILLLILQLTSSITNEAVKRVHQHQRIPKSTAVKYLKIMYLELETASDRLTKMKSINPSAVKHLFKSIQAGIEANRYLLKSSKTSVKTTEVMYYIRSRNRKIKKKIDSCDRKVKIFYEKVYGQCSPYNDDQSDFNDLMKQDIEYRHIVSRNIAYGIQQDVNYFAPLATDIISSRHEQEPRTAIIEVRDAMCSGSDDYKRPSEIKVRELRAVNCTNIQQMYGIDACSIPPEIARWSNLIIWFQCPWIEKKKRKVEWAIADLILGFLRSVAKKCAPGTFVCVGITKHKTYTHQYCLDRILEDSCTRNHYGFLGGDDSLIKNMLTYGYKHKSSKPGSDIHTRLKNLHVILVFKLAATYVGSGLV